LVYRPCCQAVINNRSLAQYFLEVHKNCGGVRTEDLLGGL
jgi:hypothetical protein